MNSALDSSSKATITARLKTANTTILRVVADSSNGALGATTNVSSASVPLTYAATDGNGRISWFAVSEDDPIQLVALQCDSSGNLLVKII